MVAANAILLRHKAQTALVGTGDDKSSNKREYSAHAVLLLCDPSLTLPTRARGVQYTGLESLGCGADTTRG